MIIYNAEYWTENKRIICTAYWSIVKKRLQTLYFVRWAEIFVKRHREIMLHRYYVSPLWTKKPLQNDENRMNADCVLSIWDRVLQNSFPGYWLILIGQIFRPIREAKVLLPYLHCSANISWNVKNWVWKNRHPCSECLKVQNTADWNW